MTDNLADKLKSGFIGGVVQKPLTTPAKKTIKTIVDVDASSGWSTAKRKPYQRSCIKLVEDALVIVGGVSVDAVAGDWIIDDGANGLVLIPSSTFIEQFDII